MPKNKQMFFSRIDEPRGAPRPLSIALLLIAAVGAAALAYRTSPEDRGEFAGVSLRIEYAATDQARKEGLSGRTSIPSGYGMLFIFDTEGYYGFWMKDMLLPIDIFWLDDQGRVVHIERDVTTSTYPNVFYPNAPARYVLETAAGFARGRAVATGTPLLLKNLKRVSE